MSGIVQDMTYIYMQTGFMGLFFIVIMILVVWYFTKGRKQMADERDQMVKEQSRIATIIENCTAVINNNTKVIELNNQTRLDEKKTLEKLDQRMVRHGEQLDCIEKNQAICLDRQNRK